MTLGVISVIYIRHQVIEIESDTCLDVELALEGSAIRNLSIPRIERLGQTSSLRHLTGRKKVIFIFVFILSLRLLLRHTDGSTSSTCGLGMLTAHSETPIVTETSVSTDLLKHFQIFTQLDFQDVGDNL